MIRLLFVLLTSVAVPAWAQQGSHEALQWLQRVAAAAQRLTYSGTFVFQSGNQSESSRIVHVVEGGSELERIEVLDGSPREVVRRDDEVKCFLPESRLLIVERRGSRRGFPALLPASLSGLGEYYTIQKGPLGRVAEREGQMVMVEPKDEFRYGRQFWVDTQSGLLLKASLLNEKGGAIETFAFTKLEIGNPMDREAVKPRSGSDGGVGRDWQVHNVRATETRGDDGPWIFRSQLPGFRKLSGMKRQVRPDGPEVTHVVFSDGLAAISVFLEPSKGESIQASQFAMGAINVYQRPIGDYRLVVMGDVPPAGLRHLGDHIEIRKK